jgi:hypothetical protein
MSYEPYYVTQYFIVNSHANSIRCQEMGFVASLVEVNVCAFHYCGQSARIMLSAPFPQFHSSIKNKQDVFIQAYLTLTFIKLLIKADKIRDLSSQRCT